MFRDVIKIQPPMTRVLLALIPVTGAAVYYFGLRCLVMLAVVNIAGFSAEYFFAHYYKEKVTEAVFVSNCLFALILPPGLPYWMAVIGIVFGIIFGKMVYGGFGKNIFNPALTGRVFIYINFAVPMTGRWYSPVAGQGGGLIRYTADALTGATPMQMMKNGTDVSLIKLFLGNTSGCMGETCALFIIAGGLYLIYRKAASYQIVSSCIAAMFLLQGILHLSGIPGAIPPLRSVLGGGFLFGAFFMATDPVSACKTKPGKWVYGALIGILTVIIRTFSIWAEGVMFAVLLANMFAPVIDLTAKTIGKKAK